MKTSVQTNAQLVKSLKGQVKQLQTQLQSVQKASGVDEYMSVKVGKAQARFERVKNPEGPDHGIGRYLLIAEATAKKEDVYIPLSVASGKKASGFVYQIEGTAESSLRRAQVEVKKGEVTLVTLGTLTYCRIPAGKKAEFRFQFEIKGKIGKSYTIAIARTNYKLSPKDARYKQYQKEIRTNKLQFK